MKYKLRYHHLLCLQFYISKGYSEEFISNMDYLYHNLKDDDEIILIKSNDIICDKCPNLINGKCNSIDKVNKYDNYIENIIKSTISDCNFITYKKYKQIIYDNIITKHKLSDICKDCQWHNLCLDVMKEKYEEGKV